MVEHIKKNVPKKLGYFGKRLKKYVEPTVFWIKDTGPRLIALYLEVFVNE